MSNITFSGAKSLQRRLLQSDLRASPNFVEQSQVSSFDASYLPEGLKKYKNILDKFADNHELDYDQELEKRLKALDSEKQKPQAELQLSNFRIVEDNEQLGVDDILTNKETIRFIKETFQKLPIKLNNFVQQIIQVYSVEFATERERKLFLQSFQDQVTTIDKNILSLNALEVCTKEKGLYGLIEEIVKNLSFEREKQKQTQINSEIVEELISIKDMLDNKKKAIQMEEKQIQLIYAQVIKQVQNPNFINITKKSDMGNSISQQFEIWVKMLEELYENKLSMLNKRFATSEGQLKQKMKILETKSQLVNKNSQNSNHENQKLRAKITNLEKQLELYKLKFADVEKKLSLEKELKDVAQLKAEKLNQKINTLEKLNKEMQVKVDKSMVQSLDFSTENILQEKLTNKSQISPQKKEVKPPKLQSDESNKNLLQLVDIFYRQIVQQVPQTFGIDRKEWEQQFLSEIAKQLETKVFDLSSVNYSKNCCFILSDILLKCLRNNEYSVSDRQQQDNKMSQKASKSNKQIRHSELINSIVQQLEKKKSIGQDFIRINNCIIVLLLSQEIKPIQLSLQSLSEQVCDQNVKDFLVNMEIAKLLIQFITDRNAVDTLLELVSQGPHLNEFMNQIVPFTQVFAEQLTSKNLEFCEKISIILQRVVYYKKIDCSDIYELVESKLKQVENCEYELLKSNLRSILK